MKTSSSYEDFQEARAACARIREQWAKTCEGRSGAWHYPIFQSSPLMAAGASHNVTIFGQGVVQKSFSDYFEVVFQPQSTATSTWLNVKAGANVDPDVLAYLRELIDFKFPTPVRNHSVHDVEQFAADEFDAAVLSWGGGSAGGIFFNGMGRCVFATNTPQTDAQKRWAVIGSTPVAPASNPTFAAARAAGAPVGSAAIVASKAPSAPGPFNSAAANPPPAKILPAEPRVIKATVRAAPGVPRHASSKASIPYSLWTVNDVGASTIHRYIAHNYLTKDFIVELEVILASDCDGITVTADGGIPRWIEGPFPAGATLQLLDAGGQMSLKSWQDFGAIYVSNTLSTTIHRDEEAAYEKPMTPSQIKAMATTPAGQEMFKEALVSCYTCSKLDYKRDMFKTSSGVAVCDRCWADLKPQEAL